MDREQVGTRSLAEIKEHLQSGAHLRFYGGPDAEVWYNLYWVPGEDPKRPWRLSITLRGNYDRRIVYDADDTSLEALLENQPFALSKFYIEDQEEQ